MPLVRIFQVAVVVRDLIHYSGVCECGCHRNLLDHVPEFQGFIGDEFLIIGPRWV
jgi:hypothetical protein